MPQITIDIPTDKVQRILDAFGRILNKQDPVTQQRIPATAQDVKQYLVQQIKNTVYHHEKELQMEQTQPTMIDIG